MAFFHSNFMLQTPHQDDHNSHPSLAPFLPPSCTPQEFHGVASLLGKRSSMAFSTGIDVCEDINNHVDDDQLSDDGSQFGERKRRLNMEQVKTLEKNFELGNKLEPERKMQLARALGLQPRQIAIWFQNRRARWKTKQLEKDYEILKRQFEAVKANNDALQAQNQKLHSEIMALKNREPTESINLNKETEGSCSNRSENSSEIKLDISRTSAIDSPSSTNPTTAGRLFFPTSLRPNGVEQQFFHNSSRPETHGPKIDQAVKEESLCNMFCSMDDQTGFWPWLEQQHFN
ncbi:hypothetical protein BUALT_Bualt05G0150000 [Buddleja alternifolia]|uniref:Homeobox-leucine zipper protein n=1 Tax=Buddleja alternifolia TaxID=168488 RepID=A0AAV6XKU6_9LAMI|nr:hypothetical protein BUALT_Bualt05G0150000 [Buddleja alternifolia]